MRVFPAGLAGPHEAHSPPGKLQTAMQTVSKSPTPTQQNYVLNGRVMKSEVECLKV